MNAAIFIETRLMEGLPWIVQQHMSKLPDDYELIIYCSRINRHVFNGITCHKVEVRINSLMDYNALLMSIDFWKKYVEYDNVLIFQQDSMILREGIREFEGYAFIGAPLYHFNFPCMNGGFSLRDPKMMYECITSPFMRGGHNEDIQFCLACDKIGMKLPHLETAKKFSVETIFGLGSFGIHAIDKWLTPQQCKLIRNQYVNKENRRVSSN